MKEAQEFGLLLNQRQKLFNVPVIAFDALNKLIKEFEPYKTLWLTASGKASGVVRLPEESLRTKIFFFLQIGSSTTLFGWIIHW